jgi:hypothetical protein
MALQMALASTRRCTCAAVVAASKDLPGRPLAAPPCHTLRRRVATAAAASSLVPRLPPRLRLRREAAPPPPAPEDSASALATAGRLIALALAAAGGIGGGYFVGTAVRAGLRPPTPAELEVKQLESAATAGDTEAIHNLGIRYTTGVGVTQDVEKGVSLYRVAAEAGHAGARCRLGAAYRSGCGVEEDMTEALRHFELATAAGHAEAQFNLAVMIEAGGSATEAGAQQQTPADLVRVRSLLPFLTCQRPVKTTLLLRQVLDLYTKAAEGGFAPALFNLGTWHWHGHPQLKLPPNKTLAVRPPANAHPSSWLRGHIISEPRHTKIKPSAGFR